MLEWIFRKPKSPPASPGVVTPDAERADVAMHWRSDTRLPIPDWQAMGAIVEEADTATLDRYYAAAASQWLDALRKALPDGDYEQRGSANFLLMSPFAERTAALVLERCEQALRAVRAQLGPLALDGGHGPYIVMVFASRVAYYDYLDQYAGADGGDHPPSSGVFINECYGHFASWHDALDDL